MSTRTARRTASVKLADAEAPKSTATRRKSGTVKKSKVVTLTHKAEKTNSHQFEGEGLITGLYVSKDAIALLNEGQKTIDLKFAPHDKQPKNSFRFTEQGDVAAIGSLYLMRDEAAKLSIDETSKVKVRLSEGEDQTLKVTVGVA